MLICLFAGSLNSLSVATCYLRVVVVVVVFVGSVRVYGVSVAAAATLLFYVLNYLELFKHVLIPSLHMPRAFAWDAKATSPTCSVVVVCCFMCCCLSTVVVCCFMCCCLSACIHECSC